MRTEAAASARICCQTDPDGCNLFGPAHLAGAREGLSINNLGSPLASQGDPSLITLFDFFPVPSWQLGIRGTQMEHPVLPKCVECALRKLRRPL